MNKLIKFLRAPICLFISFLAHLNVYADEAKNCNDLMDKGQFDQALIDAQKIVQKDNKNREAWLCLGRAQVGSGKPQESLTAFTTAEKLSTNTSEHIAGLLSLAFVQKNVSKYDDALSSCQQALKLAKEDKNSQYERVADNEIGDILVKMGQPESGLGSYIAGSKLAANDNERAENYQLMAITYSELKKYDLAIENQIKARLMQQQSGTLDDYANASLMLGNIYTLAGEYANAERVLNQEVKFAKDNGGAYYEAKGLYFLSLANLAVGNKLLAKSNLSDAEKIASSLGDEALIYLIKHAGKAKYVR